MEVLSTQPRGEYHTIRALRRGLPSTTIQRCARAILWFFCFPFPFPFPLGRPVLARKD